MLVLVTGGAGFVGSHVVDQLVSIGVGVRVLDSLDPSAHASTPDYLRAEVDYRMVALGDEAATSDALRGVDAVCHQAARVGLGVDFSDVEAYVSDNDLGTAILLRAMFRHGFRGRLVLASSMVVYGEGGYSCPEHGVVRPNERTAADLAAGRWEPLCPECRGALVARPVPEDSALDPRNVYAATKLHQEHLCTAFSRETGSPVCALRYHNVYGPRMPRNTPYAGVASIFRSALEMGQSPRVFEDGAQIRDFVHVADVARANVLALTSTAPARGPLNIASGRPRTVGDLAGALTNALRRDGGQPVITGEWRSGDVRHVFASPARAMEVLGFQAEVDFAEGVAEFATAPLRDPVGGPSQVP